MTTIAAATQSLMKAEGLVKVFRGRKVVDGVEIAVAPGEVVGLLGPNGAGKTTSFYMIVGLIAADSGRVMFRGQDVTGLPMYQRARMGMGYLAQEPSVFRKLSVEDNIMAILETLPLPKEDRASRLESLLDELDIKSLRKSKAYVLSGGERRRLEITRALVTNPTFMLLDEPFSGVDPLGILELRKIIEQLKKKGIGILLTDHNVRETLPVVDRAYILYQGKVMSQGTSEFLINDPVSKELYLGPEFSM